MELKIEGPQVSPGHVWANETLLWGGAKKFITCPGSGLKRRSTYKQDSPYEKKTSRDCCLNAPKR